MPAITATAAWKALTAHRRKVGRLHLRSLFAADPQRFERFSLAVDGLLLDYSKNRITDETLACLIALAKAAKIEEGRKRMFAGQAINTTEKRAVLHTALRAPEETAIQVDGADIMPGVREVLRRMKVFTEAVHGGKRRGHTGKPLRQVVNIGIGGSDLGPAMATEALTPFHQEGMDVRFVSNVDASHLHEELKGLDLEQTLFLIASKTFTTQETMTNARTARAWLAEKLGEAAVPRHFAAMTTNYAEALKFGIERDVMFEFWDWVGGRYSLWSAIGLPIALAVGWKNFEALLAGARAMDEHFLSAPLPRNMPVLMALLGVWYVDFFGAETQAIIPYDHYLRRFPAHLQQLDMESNGKAVTKDGETVAAPTGPVIFGAPGTDAQHSFFQLLHQSPRLIPIDFLVAAESQNPIGDHHQKLVANCLAQTEALMRGRTLDEVKADLKKKGLKGKALSDLAPHKVFTGNRPTNTLMSRRHDPRTLGMLIALYEHKVFVQGLIWGINSFDQWGVELGKELCQAILPELAADGSAPAHDASTNGLISRYREWTRR
jgi:glucose-6-phosphate isomerase